MLIQNAGAKSPAINPTPEHSISYAPPQFQAVHHTDITSPILWYVPNQQTFSLFVSLQLVNI